MSTIKRILLALSFAIIFVALVYALLINRFFRAEAEDEKPKLTQIERLSERETIELFDKLGMEYDPKPKGPNLDVPVYEPPKNDLDGFVLLQVVVKKDGSVASVEVLGAKPEGLYEEQAKEEALQNIYPIKKRAGVAIPYEIEEIIEFDVKAFTTSGSSDKAQ